MRLKNYPIKNRLLKNRTQRASCTARRSRIISSTSSEVVPKTSCRISLAVCSSWAFLSDLKLGKTCRSILGLLCRGHPSCSKTPAMAAI